MDETKKKSGMGWLLMIILIIVLLGVLWFLGKNLGYIGGSTGGSEYQAVFLSNNQVYFGKVNNSTGEYATLTDIFYLQVSQPLQPSQPNSQVNLVKLGDELHGPADIMEINRDHILFIEDLKPESQVVKAIEQYKSSRTTQPVN